MTDRPTDGRTEIVEFYCIVARNDCVHFVRQINILLVAFRSKHYRSFQRLVFPVSITCTGTGIVVVVVVVVVVVERYCFTTTTTTTTTSTTTTHSSSCSSSSRMVLLLLLLLLLLQLLHAVVVVVVVALVLVTQECTDEVE